jgi:general secretion pathway protein L
MSTLLLFLPPRNRLRAAERAAPAAPDMARAGTAREYDWALTADGRQIDREGRSAASALPAAGTVIAVVAESDVSWRQLALPHAGRQMRAALAGRLEESLLDEPDSLHFALAPDSGGGDTAWVAIASRPWLMSHLAELDAAQVFVDRIAPLSWPDEAPRGHFFEPHGSDELALRWSHAGGVATLPLQGGLTRQLIATEGEPAPQWTATPAAATAAERWLGHAVSVQTPAQRALAVIDNGWDLRQFELAPRARGVRALRLFARTLMHNPWKPVRIGLLLLIAVEVLGLNYRAWHLQREISARRDSQRSTLTAAFPQVRAVLDAPVQMQKQLDLLRTGAGAVGDADLEALLGAAATAWPADRPPADALAFEPGRLTLAAPGWTPPQIDNFRSQLQSDGWQLDASDGKLTLSRAAAQGRR